jgi:hypothetical protein
MDKYDRQSMLGRGSFASAWLVVERGTGIKYVMKEMKTLNKQDLHDAIVEAGIHSQQSHPNIIQ